MKKEIILIIITILSLLMPTVNSPNPEPKPSDMLTVEHIEVVTDTYGELVNGAKFKVVDYYDESTVYQTATTNEYGILKFTIQVGKDDMFDGLIQLDDERYEPANINIYHNNGCWDDDTLREGYPLTIFPNDTTSSKCEIILRKK